VLVILDGHGVRLSHKFDEESDPDIVEIGRLDPYEFPGDVPSRCDLIDGPVTDLSVFFRKGEIEAKVEVVVIDSTFDWQPTGKWNLIFVQSGSLSINDQTIQMGDVGFLECITGNQDGSIPITAELSGTTLVLTELTDL
jgi:environmental stress-induced protein Ves